MLLMFVVEKVLLLLVISLTANVDLVHLNNDDFSTCVLFLSSDPMLLLLAIPPFSTVTLRMYMANLHVEDQSCRPPVLMAIHITDLSPGEKNCLQILGNPLRCQLRHDWDGLHPGYHTFSCLVIRSHMKV